MAEGRMSRDQAVSIVDKVMGQAHSDLEGASSEADKSQGDAIADLDAFIQAHPEIAGSDYVGDLKSEAAKAHADKKSRNAQYETLDHLKGWMDPSLTAEERFMAAKLRADEERDERGAREAALRDLAARGVRSGAAEMASVLGAQGITSQNRMLGDLGALANAQKRAEWATEAFGNEANTLSEQTFNERFQTGSATDAMAKFNNQLKQDYNFEQDKLKLENQGQQFDMAKTLSGLKSDSAQQKFTRADSIAGKDLTGAGLKVSALTGGTNNVLDIYKVMLGQQEADKAAALLNKKKSEGLLPDSMYALHGAV
jgi:hypothetical protein